MVLVCKAGCNRKLNVSHECDLCQGTYHKVCGKLKKVFDNILGEIRLCGECQLDPINIAKYDLTPDLLNKRKRKKTDSSSASSDESEEDQIENPSLSDVLTAIKDHKKSNKKSFKKINSKIDDNTFSINENKRAHETNQNEIKSLTSEVSSLKATISNELSITGHLGALDPKADLVSLAVSTFNFMGILVTAKHIRRTRIMKISTGSKPFSEVLTTSPEPPRIIVTMYSHSKFLRILDAKKIHPKILNSDVTANSTSAKQIYINAMLSKEFYELQKKCKVWAKENNFKFVWYSEGRILIKKENKAPVFSVRKAQDLDDIPSVSQMEVQPTLPPTQTTISNSSTQSHSTTT